MTATIFMVFGGDIYYPSGGMEDFQAQFSTFAEAEAFAMGFVQADCLRWSHVADATTHQVLAQYKGQQREKGADNV